MSTPLHNEMAAALASLREEHEKITAAVERVRSATTTVTADDRMFEVTVDGRGKLLDLKFSGRRWRELAPAELSGKLIETITKAQELAAAGTQGTFTELMPKGLAPNGFELSSVDALRAEVETMLNSAATDSTRMWTK
ncbi:YbaB/EbfC family nucleoid-associated protein [Actinokineospora inagensis]|uniref:YbaB/EbfC family nucleoid-associated protein n=1 Tax=Actinokineospora inagensis TaxID=103730 RepID=UPI000424BE38|nr:YbaB/EbfC family nucleoid-associated protein [Actinokineospora inagensis]